MKSRGVRVLIVVLAIAAMAGAGAAVWQLEQRNAAAQSSADAFERDAREAVVALADWRAAWQAYVAEGQPAEAWITKAAAIGECHRAQARGAARGGRDRRGAGRARVGHRSVLDAHAARGAGPRLRAGRADALGV